MNGITRRILLAFVILLPAPPAAVHAADRKVTDAGNARLATEPERGAVPAAAAVAVTDLRCEYRVDPLGVDVASPGSVGGRNPIDADKNRRHTASLWTACGIAGELAAIDVSACRCRRRTDCRATLLVESDGVGC